MHRLFIRTAHHSAQLFIHWTNTANCRPKNDSQLESLILEKETKCVSGKCMAYSLVGKKLGESSLFFNISLHLLTVSNSRNVSPTENSVDRQLANSFRVGGPGDPWIWVVNCSTSFFWHAFMSDCEFNRQNLWIKEQRILFFVNGFTFWAATKPLSKYRSHSNTYSGFLWSGICLNASSLRVKLCVDSIFKRISWLWEFSGFLQWTI